MQKHLEKNVEYLHDLKERKNFLTKIHIHKKKTCQKIIRKKICNLSYTKI